MSTTTRSLGLNAVFFQEIKEDNSHLRKLLCDVTQLLDQHHHIHVRPRVLAETLGELRDQLAVHFSLEEFFGYFDDAVDIAPHLSDRANLLRSQHGSLFAELCVLVDDAESLAYGEVRRRFLRRIVISFDDFHRKLQDHEALENELVVEALCDDIGVGD